MKKSIYLIILVFMFSGCKVSVLTQEEFLNNKKKNFIFDVSDYFSIDNKNNPIVIDSLNLNSILKKYNKENHKFIILLNHTDRYKFDYLYERSMSIKDYIFNKGIDTTNTTIYFLFEESVSKYEDLENSRIILLDNNTLRKIK
jgi:hypothetical protein